MGAPLPRSPRGHPLASVNIHIVEAYSWLAPSRLSNAAVLPLGFVR